MMTTHVPRLIAFSLSLAVSTSGLVAQAHAAEPPAAESDEVVELDAQANAAYQAGAFESAAKMFAELYERTDDPNYLYNLSVCHDRAGALQDALDALDRYAAESPDHDEDAVAAKRRGLEIRIETEQREAAAEDDAAPEVPQDSAVAAVPPPSNEDDRPMGRSKPLDIAGGVALGLGVTGLGIGIGFGIASNNNKDDVEANCVPGDGGLLCSDAERKANDNAKAFALGADISIIAGAAFTVAGATLLIVNTVRAKKNRGVAVAPVVGPRVSGVAVTGRF